MKLEFLPDAQQELIVAVAFYEQREKGLGQRLRDELAQVCNSIVADPFLWRERDSGYRRVNLPVFPYYVAYFIRAEKIIVAAVAHNRQKPGYWKRRSVG